MNIVRWGSTLPSRNLPTRLAVLTVVMLGAYGCVLFVAVGNGSVAAASLAAGVCLASAVAALLMSCAFRHPSRTAAGILLPMAARTGLPLLLALIVRIRSPGLVEAGLVHYLIGFYLLALATEIPMSLPRVERSPQRSEEGNQGDGSFHG
jgi:hypothetical protein